MPLPALSGERFAARVDVVLLPDGTSQKARKCLLPGVMVMGICGLLVMDAIKKALNIAGNHIRCCNEQGVQRVDIAAGH